MKRVTGKIALVLALSFGLMACQVHHRASSSAPLFHQVKKDRLDSSNIEAIFEMEKFNDSDNMIGHSLVTGEGRQVLATQIRNREKPHLHEKHDLTVFLYRGQGVLKTEGDSIPLKSGDWVTIKRNLPHQFINKAESPARAIVIPTPAVEDDYVELDSLRPETP